MPSHLYLEKVQMVGIEPSDRFLDRGLVDRMLIQENKVALVDL